MDEINEMSVEFDESEEELKDLELSDVPDEGEWLEDIKDLEDHVVSEINENTSSETLRNEEIFDAREEFDYSYKETEFGKCAEGVLGLSDEGVRDLVNQREVGGEFRREKDDGGHLIGHRFLGSSDFENLVPQDRNFNRSAYKELENEWEALIKEGNKVYVNIETYNRDGLERPDVFMGHYVIENSEGERLCKTFSFANESTSTQEEWENEVLKMDE